MKVFQQIENLSAPHNISGQESILMKPLPVTMGSAEIVLIDWIEREIVLSPDGLSDQHLAWRHLID